MRGYPKETMAAIAVRLAQKRRFRRGVRPSLFPAGLSRPELPF
jgi:hypothetical protein